MSGNEHARDSAQDAFCRARSIMPCLPGSWARLALIAGSLRDYETCASALTAHRSLASQYTRTQMEPIWRQCSESLVAGSSEK
jgi:hypothetical protein